MSSCSTGEHRPGTTEARGDLVADEQDAELVAQITDLAQVTVGLHQHAGGSLDQRLDDHGGETVGMLGEQPAQVIGVAGARLPGVEEQRVVDRMEQVDAAHRDRSERVAVICVLEADEPGPLAFAALRPPLEGHLEGDLHRGRTAVGIEHAAQRPGRQRHQLLGQLDRRRVGEAEQRRVGDAIELVADGGIDGGVPMAVDVAPQR